MPYSNTHDLDAALDAATGDLDAPSPLAAARELAALDAATGDLDAPSPLAAARELVARARETAAEPILQHFAYDHLPGELAEVSKPFGDLAHFLVDVVPRNDERSAALRKILEAKDAAVRAMRAK